MTPERGSWNARFVELDALPKLCQVENSVADLGNAGMVQIENNRKRSKIRARVKIINLCDGNNPGPAVMGWPGQGQGLREL